MDIKKTFSELPPESKRKLTILVTVIAFIIIAFLGYYATRGGKGKTVASKTEKPVVVNSLKPHVLEKTVVNELRGSQSKLINKVDKLAKTVEKIQKEKTAKPAHIINPAQQKIVKNFPPPIPPSQASRSAKNLNGKPLNPVILGNIAIQTNGSYKAPAKASAGSSKKKARTIYLPPSFMEASLLSGLDAPTANGASGQPVPVLLRVRDIAVLPNDVKANLKGCFVIADGYGRLDTERVSLRLVSLSCIAKNGHAVIDQPVKGFIVDSDGKIGLKGTVVSKMGSILAREAFAGFLEGFGDAVQTAGSTNNITALGTTTTFNTKNIGRQAIAGGIGKASKKLASFYAKLADQTLPVIEVGATKRVTLVISKGVKLKIMNYCVGGSVCD